MGWVKTDVTLCDDDDDDLVPNVVFPALRDHEQCSTLRRACVFPPAGSSAPAHSAQGPSETRPVPGHARESYLVTPSAAHRPT